MAVSNTNAGFRLYGRRGGGVCTTAQFYFKDTETLTKGDMVNIESGEADLAVTSDANIIGIALETKAGTDSTTLIEVVTDPEAIYAVYDANARNIGALLDISGATGAQTVAASSNNEFIVVGESSASEETLVMIYSHFLAS